MHYCPNLMTYSGLVLYSGMQLMEVLRVIYDRDKDSMFMVLASGLLGDSPSVRSHRVRS